MPVFEGKKRCAPGVTRTPDPRIRNPLLCPAELRAHLIRNSLTYEIIANLISPILGLLRIRPQMEE